MRKMHLIAIVLSLLAMGHAQRNRWSAPVPAGPLATPLEARPEPQPVRSVAVFWGRSSTEGVVMKRVNEYL